jgi:uroporphyrin-3 C-methyltransferase
MEKKEDQQEVSKDIEDAEVKSSSSKVNPVWIAIAILLCLHGGLYWLWYQQQAVNSQLEQQIAAVDVPAVATPVDTTAIEKSIAVQADKHQQDMAGLKEQQTALTDAFSALRDSQQMTKGDVEYYWAIAEVTYLLNVANQQLLLAHNVEGAKEALHLSDIRVESLNDYRLHPLRAKIADELLALNAVNKVDTDGLSLQLDSAMQAVNKLQVINAAPVSRDDDVAVTGDNWQSALGQAWQEVKSLVVIRHQQDGTAAVLVPEQRYFLYQNLMLKLEAAQLALLKGSDDVYKQNLDSAIQWLQQYFVGDERDAMLVLLEELKAQKIDMTLPDISSSLTWLRGFAQ